MHVPALAISHKDYGSILSVTKKSSGKVLCKKLFPVFEESAIKIQFPK